MLVLFESAVGLALFKVKDGKLEDKDLHKQFDTEEGANNLSVFPPFEQRSTRYSSCGTEHKKTGEYG
jgi:hypothetical protein